MFARLVQYGFIHYDDYPEFFRPDNAERTSFTDISPLDAAWLCIGGSQSHASRGLRKAQPSTPGVETNCVLMWAIASFGISE